MLEVLWSIVPTIACPALWRVSPLLKSPFADPGESRHWEHDSEFRCFDRLEPQALRDRHAGHRRCLDCRRGAEESLVLWCTLNLDLQQSESSHGHVRGCTSSTKCMFDEHSGKQGVRDGPLRRPFPPCLRDRTPLRRSCSRWSQPHHFRLVECGRQLRSFPSPPQPTPDRRTEEVRTRWQALRG